MFRHNARHARSEIRSILKYVRIERRAVTKQYGETASRRSSKKEHKADALALGAEEGRDKLRKAAVRSKYPATRRYPNEGTHIR